MPGGLHAIVRCARRNAVMVIGKDKQFSYFGLPRQILDQVMAVLGQCCARGGERSNHGEPQAWIEPIRVASQPT